MELSVHSSQPWFAAPQKMALVRLSVGVSEKKKKSLEGIEHYRFQVVLIISFQHAHPQTVVYVGHTV